MRDERYLRRKERYDRNFVRTSSKTLELLKDIRNDIDGIEVIYEALENLFVKKEIDLKDKPVIGTFCYMIPDEIIMAANGFPIKLCGGNYIAQVAGDEIAPRDSCPVVKSAIGSFEMSLLPIYEKCELAIVPMSCDCKKKMAEQITKYTKVLPLHIPSIKTEEALEDVVDLYQSTILEIEKVTGHKVTVKSLLKAIDLTREINKEAHKLMRYKMQENSVITGSQAMAIVNAYQYMDRAVYLRAIKRINKALRKKTRKKRIIKGRRPRIMITGSPIVFPNYKLPLTIEGVDALIVADETCAGDRMLSDPVGVTSKDLDSLIRALVVKSILPCTCPTFSFNRERIFKIKQMIKDYKVEGILYHVLRGCMPYDFEQRNIEKLSAEIGVPIISVETDYNTEDKEQIKIRLEAFVEMLKMR